MTISYQLGISSVDAITLYPEYNLDINTSQERTDHRAKDGTLYQYRWSQYRTYDLDLQWVPSSDAALVNSWFESNADLIFFINSGGSTAATAVRIMNDTRPFSELNAPYTDYYQGALSLEATSGI